MGLFTRGSGSISPQDRQESADIAQDLGDKAQQLRSSKNPQALLQQWAQHGDAPVTNVEGFTQVLEQQADLHRRRSAGEDV